MEEELLLVDATTGEPRSVAVAVLASAGRAATETPEWGSIEAELQQQQIEIDTDPVTARRAGSPAPGLAAHGGRPGPSTGARITTLGTSPLPVRQSSRSNPAIRP